MKEIICDENRINHETKKIKNIDWWPTDKANSILDAYLYRKSSQKNYRVALLIKKIVILNLMWHV